MGSVIGKLKPMVKMYLWFALFQMVYKLGRVLRRLAIKNVTWKHIPGYPFDPLARGRRENQHRMHDYRLEKCMVYKDAPLIKYSDRLLICNSKESVEWMLKLNFDDITKGDSKSDLFAFSLKEFIGQNGIFTLRHGKAKSVKREHEMWYHQRKTASIIFTKNKFKSLMYDTFKANSEIFLGLCEKAAQKQGQKGNVIDIQQKFFAFTMDSIQKIFFGRAINTLDKEEIDPYGEAFDGAHREMIHGLNRTFPIHVLAKAILPWPLGYIGDRINTSAYVTYMWRYSKKHAEFRRHVKNLQAIADGIIADSRKDPEVSNRRDLLALFMASKMEFSDKELSDILLHLTIAGRDTTACALTWMLYILTQNPEVEKQMCAEIDTVLQGKPATLDDLSPSNMPYLNGVLYEALRLYPPVPADGKAVARDTTYVDGTSIPEGTVLLFCPYVMGRHPDVYPDPLKVDPNRWIPFKAPNSFAFPVFQAGPRFCLGRDMAQFEAKFVIATLYQKFTFKLLEGEAEKITYSRSVTMNLANHKRQESHQLLVIPQKR